MRNGDGMTLMDAAKKGASWMRWWINRQECDCETGHSCGLDERLRELREIERAIEEQKAKDRSSGEVKT